MRSIEFNGTPFQQQVWDRLGIKKEVTGKLDINNTMLRLEEIGDPAGLMIVEDKFMGPGGKYNIVLTGMYFEAGVVGVGEVGELGGLE